MSNQIETIIDFQIEDRDKTTVFWRGILAAPIVVFFSTIVDSYSSETFAAILMGPTILALLFRGIYPSYFLHFNHALLELATRIRTYILLLNDDFPSIERNPRVAVIFPDIEGGKKLSRYLPLIKWILAIPLYIVGVLYVAATIVLTIAAWFITWSTGKYPEWALPIVLGTIRYWNRVVGYAITLVTDEYPSFSLN